MIGGCRWTRSSTRTVGGGIDEGIAILRLCSGQRLPDGSWEDGWPRWKVNALREGDYSLFAHLETV